MCAALAGVALAEEPIEVGSTLEPYSLEDQFGEVHQMGDGTRTVVFVSEMKVSKGINKWLASKDPSFLASHSAEYITDIHGMPGPIAGAFALPKMRKYPFTMLLVRDGPDAGRRAQGDSIIMARTPEEIEALLSP